MSGMEGGRELEEFSGIEMGLVLLRRGSQCFIVPLFSPFEPPTCVKGSGCDSE